MLEFFITYLSRSECTMFQQIIGISMGKTAPLLVDLFVYSYNVEFIIKKKIYRR